MRAAQLALAGTGSACNACSARSAAGGGAAYLPAPPFRRHCWLAHTTLPACLAWLGAISAGGRYLLLLRDALPPAPPPFYVSRLMLLS